MQYLRRIQVKTKTRAQRLPPTEQYRWAVSSTFVALSQHGSTASMLAGCLVGWLVGCLVAWLVRFFAVLVVVVWCVCVCVQPNQTNKRLTKQEPYRPPSWHTGLPPGHASGTSAVFLKKTPMRLPPQSVT